MGTHTLGELQHAIMQVLWTRDEATVAEVHEALYDERGLAPTTIATMLRKMENKGVVSHRVEDRHFVYRPTVTEGEVRSSMVGELVDRLFAGDAAMIIWSPFILDELAGLRDSAPPTINDDPTSPELASRTGIVTNFSGPSNPDGAAWASTNYFGITADADTEAAQAFVEYSMSDGYTATLAIAPEGKFPVRRGNADSPTAFTDAWAELPVGVDRKAPLGDLYDAAMIDEIVGGLDVAQRWGVEDGQLALASKMINSQAINRIVRQYIDGQIDAAAAVELRARVLDGR